MIDGERVLGYRAFCISRSEVAPLPKFDENAYVAESRYNARTLSNLLARVLVGSGSRISRFYTSWPFDLEACGTANNNPVSVRALAFIMAGHVRHHLNILRTSYGVPRGPDRWPAPPKVG